jgi:hypothetical protein
MMPPGQIAVRSPAAHSARLVRLAQTTYLLLHGFCVVLFVGAVPVRFGQLATLTPPALPPGWTPAALRAALDRVALTPERYAVYALGFEMLAALACIGGAWLTARRRPEDVVALLAAMALLLTGSALLPVVPALAALHPAMETVVLGLRAGGLVSVAALFYVFPTGEFVPRWSIWALCAWAGWQFSAVYYTAVALPLSAAGVLAPPGGWVLAANLAWLSASGLAQVQRYRLQRNGLRRQQIKWLLLGAIVASVGGLAPLLPAWLLPAANLPGVLGVLHLLAAVALVNVALLAWPVAVGLAAQRRWLWEADFAINRVLVYGSILALLGAMLAAILYGLTLALPEEPLLTFAAGAVVAGFLFEPLRRWLQPLVDRKVFGIRVDYHARSPASEPLPEVPQRRLGNYKLLEPISLGGLGEAYRAQSPNGGRSVAVKVLPPRFAADEAFKARFERELAAAAGIEHPHLARLFEAGEAEQRLYAVSEYLVGQDLNSFLLINGRLSLARALPILQDLAAGLDALHANGQVHGDVRLANVMLVLREHDKLARDARFPARAAFLPTTAFRTVLMNHGLARLLGTGRHVEALGYSAPEQISAGPVDARSDIYSFGALAHLLLAGVLPFEHRNPGALAIAHLRQAPADPRGRVPAMPQATADALRRALAKDPAERFASAGEFVAALQG